MRVLEARPAVGQFPMGKRKHKLKHKANDQGDSSDEGQSNAVSKCPHISKAVNFGAVKKILKLHGSIECKDCELGEAEKSSPICGVAGGYESNDITPTVWLCLQCGNQGCDRNSSHKHAVIHYKTPRSSCHALVLNLSSWALWCYDCDDDVLYDGINKLTEVVEFVRKWAGLPPPQTGKSWGRSDSKDNDGDDTSVGKETSLQRADSLNKANPATLPKVKGLSNLGNTCFFNAVMQNISQTAVLESLLSENCKVPSLTLPGQDDTHSDSEDESSDTKKNTHLPPLTINLPEQGILTQSLQSFLKDMHSSTKNSVISPSSLFSQVCRKAPRFKGFQQQDSHELLRHLLDGMKTEEINRVRTGILKKFEITESAKNSKLDDDMKLKIKEYGRQGKHTFVDDIFGGYFISTVLCEECQVPSQMLEPFLDISLPIMEEKTTRHSSLWPGKKESSSSKAQQNDDNTEEYGATSKHKNKKSKKQIRKEAKRKGKLKDKKGKDSKTNLSEEENKNSNEDSENNLSDADVEDNTESDVSRTLPLRSNNASPDPSITSEDTTLVEDSSSTMNGDSKSPVSAQTNSQHQRTKLPGNNSPKSTPNQKQDLRGSCSSINSDKMVNGLGHHTSSDSIGVKSITDSIQELTFIDDDEKHQKEEEQPLLNGVSDTVAARQQQSIELCKKAMCTMMARYQSVSHECSVQSCLNQFTARELLTGNNKFGCEHCTKKSGNKEIVYCNASKQLLIFSPPVILTLHLKRFSQVGFSLRKVSRKVDFPNILDLAPYCSNLCLGIPKGQTKVLYSLYGLVEHSGRLTGGHYTAYVKVRSDSDMVHVKKFLHNGCRIQGRQLHKVLQELDSQCSASNEVDASVAPAGKWYYISDSKVSPITHESDIFKREAYLLFYDRLF